jgi:hypothetical protein
MVQESIVRQAPYIENRTEQLLASVFGDPKATKNPGETDEAFNLRKFGRAGISQAIPGFQFAGFSPEQQQAFQLASSGIGSYAPYLQQAGKDLGIAGQAYAGGAQSYDPSSAKAYMDPYQQQVTNEALKEYDRQGAMAQNQLAGQAVKGGVFGGSRYGVQEAELGKNLQDIKSRRIFEDMSRNFQQAQGAAMGNFGDQQKRQLMSAQGFGNLAKQQAGLGALGQQLGQGDIQSLMGVGGIQQNLGQAQMEANRQQQLMAQREPFTRLGFASDILRGAPSGNMQYTNAPQTNPYAQALGLGIAGLGAYGQFNQGGGFGGL